MNNANADILVRAMKNSQMFWKLHGSEEVSRKQGKGEGCYLCIYNGFQKFPFSPVSKLWETFCSKVLKELFLNIGNNHHKSRLSN